MEGWIERALFDPQRVVAHPDLSLASGAIRGWDRRNHFYFSLLESLAAHYGFDVDQPWQGQGIAGLLMQAVQHRARERGARELWLGVWERNERAQAFYRKHGFRKVGTQIFVVGTDPQTDHVMLREL